MSSNTEVTNF